MEAGAAPEVQRHGHFWLELAIAVVLGLTAITTAWAAYEAGRSERTTISHYTEGIRDSSLSTGVLLETEQTFGRDQAIFLEYAKAAQQDNTDLAAYLLKDIMSANLRGAVLWWSKHSDKYETPFVDANPKYKTEFALGNELSDKSTELFAEAKKTHKTSDDYDLGTVIAAAALFMLGVAGVLRVHTLRIGFLTVGTLFFLAALIQVLRIKL